MTSASLDVSITHMQTYLRDTPMDALELADTGIPEIMQFLESEEGKRLKQDVRHLNDGRKAEHTPHTIREAMLEFYSNFSDVDKLADACLRLAIFSKQLHMFAMAITKGMALTQNSKNWAAGLMRQLHDMPPQVLEFVRMPEDDNALLKATTACYIEQVLGAERMDDTDLLGQADQEEEYYQEQYEDEHDDMAVGKDMLAGDASVLGRSQRETSLFDKNIAATSRNPLQNIDADARSNRSDTRRNPFGGEDDAFGLKPYAVAESGAATGSANPFGSRNSPKYLVGKRSAATTLSQDGATSEPQIITMGRKRSVMPKVDEKITKYQ